MIDAEAGRQRRCDGQGVKRLRFRELHQFAGGDRRAEHPDGAAGMKATPAGEVLGMNGFGDLHLNLESQNESGQEVWAGYPQMLRHGVAGAKGLHRRM